jgi:hypothetical protein
MNYRSNEVLGSAAIAVGTALFEVGSAGYEYLKTSEAVDEYNADMALVGAQNTADARDAARQAGFASNLQAFTSAIDKEKAKRYLIIGAAIGVPIIAGFVLMKKKG